MNRTWHSRWTTVILAPVLLACTTSSGFAQGDYISTDPYDASVAAISRGIQVRRDGSNHNILLALRQLKDDRLRPLFQSMFASDEPTLRIDALLALAELNESSIDGFLLQQLEPRERLLALMAAISLERYDETLVRSILNFPQISDVEKTMVIIMGIRLEMELNRVLLDELLSSSDPATRLIAAVLLNDVTGDSSNLELELENYAKRPLSERILTSSALIDVASWHPMPGSLALLRMVANDEGLSRSLRLAAIDAALGCECEHGITLWSEATKLAKSSGDRSRLGVAAIERGLKTPDWSGISDERQLNQRLALAGASLVDGSDLSDKVAQLMKIKHPLALQAVLASAEQTPNRDEAVEIWLMVLRDSLNDPRLQPVAGRILKNFDAEYPEEIEKIIEEASALESRVILGEVLLTAILESNPPQAIRYAEFFADHQDRTLRSLAMLVKAQAAPQLTKEEMQELSLIASGGGRINKQTRAIAGWLWLSHNDKTEQAMMEIMGKS